MSLSVLRKRTFRGMPLLQTLNLSNNILKNVQNRAFLGLNSVTSLDIRNNYITDFSADIFSGLNSLSNLYSDSYAFCCMASPPVPEGNCIPPADEISSCEDLMSKTVQRSFVWILGTIALFGNFFVIVWRIKTKDSHHISSTLILSLGFADFLMGLYLIIIASVDMYYRGKYIENSENWRNSTLCKFCGFLSTVSSEVSILTLLFITLDRVISICFPFSHKRFTPKFTYKLIAASWVSASIMAVLPLIVEPYFKGSFYARSGVCLAIHITNHRPAGWEYSVAIFFCVNLLAFIAIVSSYTFMYVTIKKSHHKMNRLMARHSRDNKIGRQMALIVMTNSLCWFPIIVMGLLAMSGVKIAGEAYSWTAVFVLPLNSATNPLIYTISSLSLHSVILPKICPTSKNRRESNISKQAPVSPSAALGKRSRDRLKSRPFQPPPGYVSLLTYLKTVPNLRPRHLLKISTAICKLLRDLHQTSYALGGIDANAVFVSEVQDGEIDSLRVYVPDFNAYKIEASPINTMPDDTALDMEEFGLLVKKMLTVYHVTSRSKGTRQVTSC